MRIGAAAVLAGLWLGQAATAETCLRAVTYDPPRSELELEQPHRLASETLVYPGYPWLIISPTNRFPLHTIRGNRFEELNAEWPQSGLWQYRDFAVRRDGSVIGFSFLDGDRGLWVLRPGATAFAQVALPEGDRFLQYDAHRDVVLIEDRTRGLLEWNGDTVVPSPLAGLGWGENMALPRFLPGPDLWIAALGAQAYVRADAEGATWQPVDTGEAAQWASMLATAPFHHDPDLGVLSLAVRANVLVYDLREPDGPRLIHDIPNAVLYGPEGGRALIRRSHPAVRQGWFNRLLGVPDIPAWEEPLVMTADGLVPFGDVPLADRPAAGAHRIGSLVAPDAYRSASLHVPAMFDLDGARYAFDGTHRVAVPHLSEDALGPFPRWFDWQGRIWLLAGGAWHELMPDLSLRDVPWPIDGIERVHNLDITPSDALSALVMTRQARPADGVTAALWITRDGATFRPVAIGDVPVMRYLSDIPETSDGLLLAEDGLHLLDLDCAGAHR